MIRYKIRVNVMLEYTVDIPSSEDDNQTPLELAENLELPSEYVEDSFEYVEHDRIEGVDRYEPYETNSIWYIYDLQNKRMKSGEVFHSKGECKERCMDLNELLLLDDDNEE